MYTTIATTKNARALFYYLEDEAHNKKKIRNELVIPFNMKNPKGNFANQMQKYWDLSSANHEVQARSIIVSAHKDEVDPNNMDDIYRFGEVCKTVVSEHFPNRQAVIYIQRDGKAGLVHAHIPVNDVAIDNFKGFSEEERYWKNIQDWFDETFERFGFKIKHGEKQADHRKKTERAKTEKAIQIIEDNPDLVGNELLDYLIENKAYSYIADLKARIKYSMENSKDWDNFKDVLDGEGIRITREGTLKDGEDYCTYEFYNCPIEVKNSKSRSNKLGTNFSPAFIKDYIKEHQEQMSTMLGEAEAEECKDLAHKSKRKSTADIIEEINTPEKAEERNRLIQEQMAFIRRARAWIDDKYGFGDDADDTKWKALTKAERNEYLNKFREHEEAEKAKAESKDDVKVEEPVEQRANDTDKEIPAFLTKSEREAVIKDLRIMKQAKMLYMQDEKQAKFLKKAETELADVLRNAEIEKNKAKNYDRQR